MKKFLLLLLTLILTGCGHAEQEVTDPIMTVSEVTIEELVQIPAETTGPEITEAEVVDETVWLPPYYTDKSKLEFHCLVKNETMGDLSVESMKTEYYLADEVVQEKHYDKKDLKNFLWRPFNELELSLAASTLLIVDDYPSEDSFDHLIVTIKTVDEKGTETEIPYNFTMDEMEVTPSTLTDNWELSTSWLVEAQGMNGWNWTCQLVNDTNDTLILEFVHHVNYDNGIPVVAETRTPDQFSSYISFVEELASGVSMPHTEGITEQYRVFNQREMTYVYRDISGQRHLQTFYFLYEDALQKQEALQFYWELNHGDQNELPEGLFRLTEDEVDVALGQRKYTESEIQKMIDDNLTLDEVAEKISTVGDLFQYMNLKGFHFGMGNLKRFYVDGDRWEATSAAHTVFKYNQGACGDGSNVVNYILRGDYDEQGFVQQVDGKERHAFNWLKKDGVYYFVDWTLVPFTGMYDDFKYYIYATEEPQIYADYYIDKGVTSEGEKYEIYLLYMYPREGNQYPYRIVRYKTPFERTLPSEIEDSVMVLYEDREHCILKFQDGPAEEKWPQ